jgi:hypothetical protein
MMGSSSISSPVLPPLKLKDEDHFLELSSTNFVKVSPSLVTVNPTQKESQ